MKKMNVLEEIAFVNTAEAQELFSFIGKHSLKPKAEKALMIRRLYDISLAYINLYGLSELAQVEVFRQNVKELVFATLKKTADFNRSIKLFLDHGAYDTVMAYMKDIDVPAYKERDIVRNASKEALLRYVAKHRISPFAVLDLIMRSKHEAVLAAIAKGRINEREKMALLKYGRRDAFVTLIKVQTNSKEVARLEQFYLVRFGKPSKLAAFIARQRFKADAEQYFLQHAPFSLVVSYVLHYNIEGGQDVLLNRNDQTEILSYLSKHKLCEESENLLLKRGIHREIKAYIKKHCFHEEAEVKFIKRGKHREIMLYLAHHSLCDEAQVELIYRRKNDEIMYFVSHYPLADVAEAALMKCGTDDVIDVYMSRR